MPADRTPSDEPLPVTFLADDGSIVINFGIALRARGDPG